MGYGKIDVMTNYLMTSQVNEDGTWRVLTDFATDGGGNLYTYYIDRNNPDMILNNAEADGLKRRDINKLLLDLTITYNGHEYGIDRISQAGYALAYTVLDSLPNGSTKIVFDVYNDLVDVNKNDIKAILTASDAAEAIVITTNW